MIKKQQKNVLLILISIALLFCVVVLLVLPSKIAYSFSGVEIEKVYKGDVFNVPEASFDVGTEKKIASFELIFPDGQVFVEKEIKLEQSGEYKIRYYYAEGKTYYEHIVPFVVDLPLYEVSGSGSAEYGYHPYINNEEYGMENGGIIVSLVSGSKFVYNKTIDLKQLTKNNPVVTFNITPANIGTVDFGRLNVKITDIYDDSNYVIMRVRDNQPTDGDWIAFANVSINDESKIYLNDERYTHLYGTECNLSFIGRPGMINETKIAWGDRTSYLRDTLSFYYDNNTSTVYKSDCTDLLTKICNCTAATGWTGFTTGEVKLEIFADMYSGATANFVIRDLAGVDLSKKETTDSDAPIINIIYENDYDDYPTGVVGRDYKVFEAKGFDLIDGVVDVKSFVYRNYYNENKISVNLKDNKFKPAEEGVYTICYVARDKFGNESVLCKDVNIVAENREIVLVLGEYDNVALQGELVSIAPIEKHGGFGTLVQTVKVMYNQQQVDVMEGKFIPEQVGCYKIIYTVTDYVNQIATTSYDIQVEYNEKPLLLNDTSIDIEKRYAVGYKYELPIVKVKVFKNDGSFEIKEATASVDNGKVENGEFTPQKSGQVNILYSYNGYEILKFNRPVYNLFDGDSLDVKRYFVHDEKISSYYNQNNYATYYVESGNAIMEYFNPLMSENFSLSFNTSATKNNVQKVNLYMVGVENQNQVVKLTISNIDGKGYLTVNDSNKLAQLSTSFEGNDKKDFMLNFSASTKTLTFGDVVETISTFMSNDKFEGFDGYKFYLFVEMEGVNGAGFELVIKALAGQTLVSSITSDVSRPIITAIDEVGGVKSINSTYRLPEVVATDVFSPIISSFTVKVVDPEGKIVVSKDNVSLNNVDYGPYEFVLNKHGKYIITYTAKDAANKSKEFIVNVNVFDLEPPEITISDDKETSADIGDTISVAEINITDNYCSNEDLTVEIFVQSPDLRMIHVKDNEFKATQSGIYTVFYYVFDKVDYDNDTVSQGNLAVASYTVYVK